VTSLATRVGRLFVAPSGVALTVPHPSVRSLVVLCRPERTRPLAASAAIALAAVTGTRCALASVAGLVDPPPGLGLGVLGSRRALAVVRAAGHRCGARGRVVWVADRRADVEAVVASDPVGAVAAASHELGTLAAATGLPAVLALSLVRTEALDRVLGWHDGLVAALEPDATEGIAERVQESLAALGLPFACVAVPSRWDGALAEWGMRAPAPIVTAVADLVRAA
jgi:hypothetical protein